MSQSDADTAPPTDKAPAEAQPAPAKTTPLRRSLRAAAAGAALTILAVAGAGAALWPRILPYATGPSNTQLAQDIADLRQELALARSAAGRPGDSAALTGRVAALEASVQALRDQSASAPALADDVRSLRERLDRADAEIRDLRDKSSSVGATLLALGQLREAVDNAMPFTAELQAVTMLAPKEGDLAGPLTVLKARAAMGIPTASALTETFHELEPSIVRAEALPAENGWWRQTLEHAMALVSVRREAAGDGNDASAAAVASRVWMLLAAGDLADAAAEAERFTGGPAEVAGPWLRTLRARVAADRALSELTARMTAAASPRP
ncbi:MAG: mitofilin family membrane protein [Magnetospirillum sp.]|nr:mitofilin family membrane protein [Magnetospirillum sp.]